MNPQITVNEAIVANIIRRIDNILANWVEGGAHYFNEEMDNLVTAMSVCQRYMHLPRHLLYELAIASFPQLNCNKK